jgi:hypothetical protein
MRVSRRAADGASPYAPGVAPNIFHRLYGLAFWTVVVAWAFTLIMYIGIRRLTFAVVGRFGRPR